MELGRRSSPWQRLILLVSVPFVLVVLHPGAAAAADDGTLPSAATGSTAQEPISEPSVATPDSPAPSEAATDGDPAPTDPAPTDAADSEVSTSQPTDPPESEVPASAEPVDEEAGTAVPTVESGDATQQAAVKQQTKVTICHRTNSRTNPYNQIVVTESAAINGHAGHRGPIFGPGVANWGDIIAPIRPGLPLGRNWPAGRAILHNGCEMQPDVGPLPTATVSAAECDGSVPRLEGTVTNDADATAPATFEILVGGVVVDTVGPLAPGESEDVVLEGGPGGALDGLEDQTVTVAVRSDGEIIGSRVFTVDCIADAPAVAISAELACVDGAAQGSVTVTDNGPDPVQETTTVDGAPLGSPLVVGPGSTATGTADLSPYEDQTITVAVLVDGTALGSYVVTPDCVAPQAAARISVAGQECPPPSTTVTLANDGDPDSTVVFVIRVNGRVVQQSAPVYGGDATTIVGDLSRFEDRTVVVSVRANGELLGRRVIRVDCEQPTSGTGEGTSSATVSDGSGSEGAGVAEAGVLPAVGADVSPGLLAIGLGLLAAGSLLILTGTGRARRPASRGDHG